MLILITKQRSSYIINTDPTMSRTQPIILDDLQVTPFTIQSAFEQAKPQNRTSDVLCQVFRLLQLSKLHDVNPSDHPTKQIMKNIVRNHFLFPNPQSSVPVLDINQSFPLNKVGNFGRELERKCKLSEKGVMEYDGGNAPKLKPIKGFSSRIEGWRDKDKDDKIGWLETNPKNYPFRIVVFDNSDGHKGIYFNTLEKAQQARVFLAQTYRYSGNAKQLFSALGNKFTQINLQTFSRKLVERSKMINKSMRYSRKVLGEASLKQSTVKEQTVPKINNSSLFFNEIVNNSRSNNQRGSYRAQQTNMLRVSGLLQTRKVLKPVLSSIQAAQLQQQYLHSFAEQWLNKATTHHKNNPRNNIDSSPNRGSYIKPVTIQPEHRSSKIDLLGTSKKQQNSYNNKAQSFNSKPQSLKNNKQQSSNSRQQGGVLSYKAQSLFNYNRPQSIIKKEQSYAGNNDKLGQSILRGLNASSIRDKQSLGRQKESFVRQFDKQYGTSQLKFFSIEFLTLDNLFFKPIVKVILVRNNKPEQDCLFNTVIKKKQPHLLYQMLAPTNQSNPRIPPHPKDYRLQLTVIDFLSNRQVISQAFTFANKKIGERTVIWGDSKLLKIQLGTWSGGGQSHEKSSGVTANSLNIPALPVQLVEKITSFGEKQWQSKGYYNDSKQSIYHLLGQVEGCPLSWSRGVGDQEYLVLQILYKASKLIGFKMVRSFIHIVRAFQTLFPDLEEMIQKLLSFILSLMKNYYFPEQLNKIHRFHRMVGLEEDCEFISKINLEMDVITKLIKFECPMLSDKLARRNITYAHQIMEYIYEAFARNFNIHCLVDLWNYLYEQPALLQLNMVLTAVALLKHYEQDLIKVKRLKDFRRVMQSQRMTKMGHILKQSISLRQKYFGQSKGLIDDIKNIFTSKPLEPVMAQFYKRESARIDRRKVTQQIDKKQTLRKVNKQVDIQLPQYPKHKYTLHVFFSRLPQGGSLRLRCNQVYYQCLNHENNRYFIVGDVNNTVTLHFLDLKSIQYSVTLLFNQGVNQFSLALTSAKTNIQHKITYTAGLLTDQQIDMFKRGKKFDHFMSSLVRQSDFLEEMGRPVTQAMFLRRYDNGSSKDDIVRRIKSLFCSGSKIFNEIDFYLEQIQTSQLNLQQKVELTRTLAKQYSSQFCLSVNPIFQKHFLSMLIEKTGFQLTEQQFQCFYADSLECQFEAPKIIKCRFLPALPQSKQIKLQIQALKYFTQRSSRFLYSDIVVDQFIAEIKNVVFEQLGGMVQGQLKLLYSSEGEVCLRAWQLKLKNKNREIYYQETREDGSGGLEEAEVCEPQVLMTEVLPTFAKISTILDYVNSNRSSDLKNRQLQKQSRRVAQNINLMGECNSKLKKVITMRYFNYPSTLQVPFLNYYYQLVKQAVPPRIKHVYLNNIKSDLQAVCLFKGSITMGESPKIESYHYKEALGLWGNLRQFSKDAKAWYFMGQPKDQTDNLEEGRVFVNYGYGVFRWESCVVLGFLGRSKGSKSSKGSSQSRKEYLVSIRGSRKVVKDYQLQLEKGVEQRIQQLVDTGSVKGGQRSVFDLEPPQNASLKYLTNFLK